MIIVRWYIAYGLSYRDIEEPSADRELTVDHTTIYRRVNEYSLKPETNFQQHRNGDTRDVFEQFYTRAG